jgi:ABC-type multidrug transport system ATPase subunit
LRCETGKVVGILGRNGCGKTTLLKMMYGEISKGEKVLRIDKKALLSNHRNPRVMRILPHYHFIPPHFTLRRIFDDYKLDFQEFVGHFPEMAKLADTKIGACSGGGIRIVEVYIILMSESQFVLLDEPFSHISPHRVEVLGALIAAEKKKKGIVITDHYYRTVMGLSDKLYLLRDGTMYPVDGEEDLIQNGYLPDRN